MENYRQDQSFDKFADKFEKNIYGSTKGRLRHELIVHHMHDCLPLKEMSLRKGMPLQILDAGGGTGIMTEVMLSLGHEVTLSDLSSEYYLWQKTS